MWKWGRALTWSALWVSLVVASACGEGKKNAEPEAEPEQSMEQEKLTFHEDVQPMLEQYCWRCHHKGGQGPGDFTDPEVVEVLAPAMMAAMEDNRMPPPVSDPACQDFLGSERMALTQDSKAMFAQWIEEGMERGQAPAQALEVNPEPHLEDPDLEVTLAQGYVPGYGDDNNPGNEYRCFALEHGRQEAFFISGLHPIVDQPSIVHHVVLAKLKRENLPAETLEMTGQNCINDMGALGNGDDGEGIIAAWAPGMEPVLFEDAGIRVSPDEVFVLQMHYYYSGPDADGLEDHSGYALKTTDAVKNEIRMAPLGTHNFVIPAGEEDYSIEDELSIPVDLTLWGVFPHMHVLGWKYSMSFGEQGGDQTCLLDAERYDFNNQLTYMFKEPMVVPANTPIRFSCTWNNSTSNPSLLHNPPRETRYGERTDEEMCYAFTYFSIGRPR